MMPASSKSGGGSNERLPDRLLPVVPRAGGADGCDSAAAAGAAIAGGSAGGFCLEDSIEGATESRGMPTKEFMSASIG